MKTLILIAALSLAIGFISPRPALGGKNSGGVVLLYTNDSVVFSSDVDYDGSSGVECLEGGAICPPYEDSDCPGQQAIAEAGATSHLTNQPVVWWLLAGWPQEACPRLKAIIFGIQYDEAELSILGYGTDANFELTTPKNGRDWPAPYSGTAITWLTPSSSHLKEVYWFAGYVYSEPTNFTIGNHPTQGAPTFGDDSLPAGVDPVVAWGVLGLANAAGHNPPIEGTPTGACCLTDGSCIATTSEQCGSQSGTYRGDGTICDESSCVPPVAVKTVTWGRMKSLFERDYR
ncbi:MAG: hypothetical protein U0527_14570 [Candidatus Eisenbacteria bacterium]